MRLDPQRALRADPLDQLEALRLTYGSVRPQDVLAGVYAEFPGEVALVSSFGADAAVLLHMVSEIDRGFPVLMLDTLMLFQETLDYASLRTGLQFAWKFAKSAEFTEEFYWTDNLSDTSDWFLRSTTAITADLTSIFALKASFTYLYDNVPALKTIDPVTFFEKSDTITAVALVAKF